MSPVNLKKKFENFLRLHYWVNTLGVATPRFKLYSNTAITCSSLGCSVAQVVVSLPAVPEWQGRPEFESRLSTPWKVTPTEPPAVKIGGDGPQRML